MLLSTNFLRRSALQILPIVITHVSRCVCLCVSLFVNLCCRVAINLHNLTIWIRTYIVKRRMHRFFLILYIDFNLQGNFFCHFIILTNITKMVRDRANMTDRKSGICHRMAQLRKLYIVTMTYIFKVTKFLEII